jgi:hypothetical protein
MVSKKRDPRETRSVRIPWKPGDQCPCGSSKPAESCCLLPDGQFYRRAHDIVPPGAVSGIANAKCYLRVTNNCSEKTSREHPVSAAVPRVINESKVKLRGAAWQQRGETGDYAIPNLASKTLCKRHNEALADLDSAAASFFQAVREMYDDVGNHRTLSCKQKWFLFSGEELELWLVKTAFGLFEAGYLMYRDFPMRGNQTLNPEILHAFSRRAIRAPCGLYVMATGGIHPGQRNSIDITGIPSTDHLHMTALSLTFMGLTFLVALDPNASFKAIQQSFKYRPSFIQYRNAKRRHSAVVTWPGGTGGRQPAVLFTAMR